MFAKCLTASAIILSTIFSFNVYAQSLSTAKAELESFKTRLSTTQAELTNIQAALQTKQTEITQITSTPSPEKDKYDLAKILAAELESQAANDPSKAGELKNAQFKLTLAERKFKKANKKLLQLNSEQKNLSEQFAINTGLVAQLEQNINGHNALIVKLQSNAVAREKTRANKQRKEMARLKAENERLKAIQQVEQKAAEQALALAAIKAEEERAIALAAEEAVKEAEAAVIIADRSTRETVTYLSNPAEIAGEEERQSSATANSKGSRKGKNKNLTIRIADELTRSISLKGLGGKQYRGKSKIAAGKGSFYLGKKSWKASIPEELRGKKVTFLLDYSDKAKPFIVFFLKQQ